MKRSRGYHSYRGRGRGRTGRMILITVAVLLVILILLFLYLSRFLVYTDNGVRLELPFFQSQEQTDPEPDGSLVVDTPEPSHPAEAEGYAAVQLSISDLTDGTAAEALSAAGGTAAVFDMKTDEGILGYVSAMQDAVNAGASQSDPMLNSAITTANGEEGLYTVARMSCFRDLQVSSNRLSYSIMSTSGYRWRDPERLRWLSPMSEGAVDYLLGVMDELCKLGFDEILLDNCAFPTGDGTNTIAPGENYPSDLAARQAAVQSFLEQARAVVEPYGVKLSVRTTAAALSGEGDESGLTPDVLLANADGLWVEESQIPGILYETEEERSAAENKLVAVLPAGSDAAGTERARWALMEETQ